MSVDRLPALVDTTQNLLINGPSSRNFQYMPNIIELVGNDRLSILNGLLEDRYDEPSVLDNWLKKYKYTLDEIKNTEWYKKIPVMLREQSTQQSTQQNPHYPQPDPSYLINTKLKSLARMNLELFRELDFFETCEMSAKHSNPDLYNAIADYIDRYPHYLDLKDKEHRSALRIACHHQNAELAAVLIKKGADVNVVNYAGNSIMHYLIAAFNLSDSKKLLDLLFDSGANMYIRNLKNQSLMQIACYYYDYNAVDYLLHRGYKVQEDEHSAILNHYATATKPWYNDVLYIDYMQNYDKLLNLIKSLKIDD